MKTKRAQLWMVVLLVGVVAGVCPACSDDGGTGTDDTNDHNSNDGRDTNNDSGGADCAAPDAAQCGGNWGVFDSASCKCWEIPGSLETFTWDEAMAYCEALTLGGHGDWVLASRYDYQDMLGGCEDWVLEGAAGHCQKCDYNSDCQRIFTSVGVLYWTESATEKNAFYVQPEAGLVWVASKTNRISARCVRAVN